VSAPLGYGNQAKAKKRSRDEDAEDEDGERRRSPGKNPVRRVLFSSFIIQ